METTAVQTKAGSLQQEREQWDRQEAAYINRNGAEAIIDAPYLRAKLLFFNQLEAKYGPPITAAGKIEMDMMRLEKRKVEKALYPNWVERQLQRAVSRWIEQPRLRRQLEQQQQAQVSGLRQALRRTGLSATVEHMQLDFSSHTDTLKVPASFRTRPDERMDLELQFKRDKAGNMQFPSYTATLKNLQDPSKDRQYTFRLDKNNGFDITEAYNLLCGRPVMRTYLNAEGRQSQEWVQLNFNERGPDGQYVMERFPRVYGFDLDHKMPSWIQFHEDMKPEHLQRIMTGLQKGNRELIHLPIDGKGRTFYAEINLRDRTLSYYDEKQQPIKGDVAGHFRNREQKIPNRIKLRNGPRERTAEKQSTTRRIQH